MTRVPDLHDGSRAPSGVVTLTHGAGGRASRELVEAVFVDAFRNPVLERLETGDDDRHVVLLGERPVLFIAHHRADVTCC